MNEQLAVIPTNVVHWKIVINLCRGISVHYYIRTQTQSLLLANAGGQYAPWLVGPGLTQLCHLLAILSWVRLHYSGLGKAGVTMILPPWGARGSQLNDSVSNTQNSGGHTWLLQAFTVSHSAVCFYVLQCTYLWRIWEYKVE